MPKTFDKKTSTTSIYSSLGDNEVPEEKLPVEKQSPDSIARKKLDAEKFFREVSYQVFIKSIYIYRDFIWYIQQQLERLQIMREQTKANFRLEQLVQVPVERKHLEIIRQNIQQSISRIKEKFDKLVSSLESKIIDITKKMEIQQTEIARLNYETLLAREVFIEEWRNVHTRRATDPSFTPIKIDMPLPAQLASIKYDYNGVISINQQDYREWAEGVANKLSATRSITKLYEIMQERLNIILERKISNQLPFLPVEEHRKLLRENEPSVEIMLQNYGFTQLNQHLHNALQHERVLNELELQRAHDEHVLNQYKTLLVELENYKDKPDELAKLYDQNMFGQSHLKELIAIENIGNSVEAELDSINQSTNTMLQNLALLNTQADELLKELMDIQQNAEQVLATGDITTSRSVVANDLQFVQDKADQLVESEKKQEQEEAPRETISPRRP